MRAWHAAVAVGILACAWSLAQEETPAMKERDQVARRIGQLEQQLQAAEEGERGPLQMQLDQLRGRLDELTREQQFREIRGHQRDRVWEIEGQIADIRQQLADAGHEMPQVRRDLARAQLAHLEKLRDLSQQVALLRGPDELPKAFETLGEMEAAEMHWQMVDVPKFEGAVRLYQMERAAAEFDNPPELLMAIEQAKKQRQALIADAENLFALWSKHRQMRREYEQGLDAFWAKLEQAQAGPERLP
jgi:chromosome segregation ATPase